MNIDSEKIINAYLRKINDLMQENILLSAAVEHLQEQQPKEQEEVSD